MKRIISNSVSDALMSVLEEAERIDQIVILYRYKGTAGEEPAHYGIHNDKDMTLESVNWLVDVFKGWVLGRFQEKE